MITDNVYEYTLWAGLTFSFPYVFKNLVIHYPQSFSFGEGVIVTSTFIYNYWTSFHNIIQSKFSDVHNGSDPILITIVQEVLLVHFYTHFIFNLFTIQFIYVFFIAWILFNNSNYSWNFIIYETK